MGHELANITQSYDLHMRVGHAGTVGMSGYILSMTTLTIMDGKQSW